MNYYNFSYIHSSESTHIFEAEHLLKNFNNHLQDHDIPIHQRFLIHQDVFGPRRFPDTPYLLEEATPASFDERMSHLETAWKEMGEECGRFSEWFVKFQSEKFRQKASAWKLQEAGISDSNSYWQQDFEKCNLDLKELKEKLHQKDLLETIDAFVVAVKEKEMFEDQALHGEGPYRLTERFSKDAVSG